MTMGRITAAAVALCAWAGLLVQCIASYHLLGSVWLTAWAMLAYFTITTNLLVAIVFTGIALGARWLTQGMVGGTMLSILLVGVVYALLLHGLTELSGGSATANVLLHMVTPVIVLLYWLFFARKGTLTRRHPWLWAIYPLAYLAYALVRGTLTGSYPYPFLNVLRIGWEQMFLNVGGIAVCFLLCGFVVVGIDRFAGRRDA